jgi:phenylacetate-CoA ligase
MIGRLARGAYAALPGSLQDIVLSAAGLKWRHDRYGGEFSELLASLRESEWWDEARMAEYQARRLTEVLHHAFTHVPHYAESARAAGIEPDRLPAREALATLPILTKEAARQAGTRLRSTAPLGRLRTYQTSGTTGTPLTIWKTAHADRFQWAVWWRHRARFGLSLGDRFLTFGAKVPSLTDKPRAPIWRTNHAVGQSYLPVSHLERSMVPEVVAWIDRKRFAFFAGYPSAMQVLASEMRDRGLRFRSPPRAVCCGSETLPAGVATSLAEVFQAPVTQVYGLGESAGGFAECERGRLHLDFELGLMELLPLDGQPADSHLRRLVFTGLQNLAMPVLRYDVGDYVEVAHGPCGCGRRSPTVVAVDGRLEDYVITPDGRRVYGLNQVFKLAKQVKEAQVFQEAADAIEVRLVPAEGYDGSDERVLHEELRLRLGPATRIAFRRVAAIPRTSSGKLRAVVSTLPAAILVPPAS